MAGSYSIKETFAREWNRIRNKVDKLSGDGVTNNSTYITISQRQTRDFPRPTPIYAVTVRVEDDATGGGKYFGYVLLPPDTPPNEDDEFNNLDSGTAPHGDYDALICNRQEQNRSTHDLTDGTPIVTDFIGYTFGQYTSDNKLIVYINGTDWEDCS